MTISTRGRYGLLAMVDVAARMSDERVTLKSVAQRHGISEHYLEQLFSVLKKAGYIQSIRGAQGGYRFCGDPAAISAGDILRTLEGSLYPVACLAEDESVVCGSKTNKASGSCGNCVTRPIWEKIHDGFNEILDSFTLADLVRDYQNMEPEGERHFG